MSSSNNSTNNNNNNNNNNNTNNGSNQPSNNSGLGAATYYSAVAVVVSLLIAIAVTSRILYTRRNRRIAAQASLDPEASARNENEERLAMERRGEEAGLPTYRQSILNTSPENILDSTPMSSHPFGNLQPNHSVETLPGGISTLRGTGDPIIDNGVQPPKYEDDPLSPASLEIGSPAEDTTLSSHHEEEEQQQQQQQETDQSIQNQDSNLPQQQQSTLAQQSQSQTQSQTQTQTQPHLQPQQPQQPQQVEMRMMNGSNVTLVLPSIQIHDTDQQVRLHSSRDSSLEVSSLQRMNNESDHQH